MTEEVKYVNQIEENKHFKKIRSYLPQNKDKLFVLIVIAIAIPLTVVLALTQQNLFSRANFPATPATPPGPEITPTPTPTTQSQVRVFVTSQTYDGNLVGLSGADMKCQVSANAANLGGEWRAWLSDYDISAESRVTRSTGAYKLLNDIVIADNWSDLTDGSIANPINVTELGTQLTGTNRVWSNTGSNGKIYRYPNNTTYDCNNWTDNTYATYGFIGYTDSKDNRWTTFGDTHYCAVKQRLYCFEKVVDPTPTMTEAPTSVPTVVPTEDPTPSPTEAPTAVPTPIINKVILTPIEDAFVSSLAPSTNYGKLAYIQTDASPNMISYMKFNLSPYAGKKIVSAKLILRVNNAAGPLQTLRRADDTSWTEKGITYTNRPRFASKILDFSAKPVEKVIELNVFGAVNLKKGNNLTLAITTLATDDIARFYSRESSASNRPILVIEYQ